MNKQDVKIEYTKGKGPGGQHKNKVQTMVRATHIPTGITVTQDGRHRHRNEKKALAELERRVVSAAEAVKAKKKKARRDEKIHEHNVVRTYNFAKDTVKDHRSGKTASIKQVVEKGRLDLL